MSLPIRTILEDIDVICGYLTTKPTGATLAEAKAVVDSKRLDGRKLAALKFWGLIEDAGDKTKITETGRRTVRDSGAFRSEVLRDVVRKVAPYSAVVERVVHRHEKTIAATDIAAHWHEHFRNEVSDSDKILNDQALCFFQIAQGADLGTLVVGRKGMPTRFEFDPDAARAFVNGINEDASRGLPVSATPEDIDGNDIDDADIDDADLERSDKGNVQLHDNRVFITHGKNLKILDQVKQIVMFGKFEPVVAMEHESLAMPVPKKIMDEMRKCGAAVIHVSVERVLLDKDGNEVQLINENVLIEIGAAMALYGDRFILLVEEGVILPSNLQGLYECRYHGSELDMPATMKLLEAFNEFGSR